MRRQCRRGEGVRARWRSSAIEIQGSEQAVRPGARPSRDLSFTVDAGRVTGFLGPNGAGKSTTLRMLLGLIHSDGGAATFAGPALRRARPPERARRRRARARELPPGPQRPQPPARARRRRTASRVARGRGARAGGLTDAADRRVKGYSMGMRQRLAIAAALLGDPEVLILDEPVNGLDPPGIRWIRGLLREQAGRGRAVLVSSHLLSEVAQSVDDVVVISHGVLRAERPARAGARQRGRRAHARAHARTPSGSPELLRAQDVRGRAGRPRHAARARRDRGRRRRRRRAPHRA